MITDRIKTIIEAHGLTASGFADALHVQRSGMSHLFSGRNKPSLDLVLKIVESFPEVTLDWLLLGQGTYPLSGKEVEKPDDTDVNTKSSDYNSNVQVHFPEQGTDEGQKIIEQPGWAGKPVGLEKEFQSERPDGIIVLYDNGTFESYQRAPGRRRAENEKKG